MAQKKSLISKLWEKKYLLRDIFPIIYVNFKCLPFRQAIKLPIFLYRPSIKALKAKITIKGDVKTSMIILGRLSIPFYPNRGIVLDLNGGHIIFDGKCSIGGNSAISTGSKGIVEFGDNFICTSSLKLASYDTIRFGSNVLVGWDCMFIDSDFHKLTYDDGHFSTGHAPISIGDYCWIGTGCTVTKGTVLPAKTTVQARSVLNHRFDIPEGTIIGPDTKVVVKKTGCYHNPLDDKISY